MPVIAGIDEAGRGPVIGPLVLAIAAIDTDKVAILKEMGVKDSKELSPSRRCTLFEELKTLLLNYKFVIIPPSTIDSAVKAANRTNNLNWLEANKSIELIKLMVEETKIDELFIDCPSTNIKSYLRYLKRGLKIKLSCIVAEHKADKTYPIVSAASILAKVIRDREIQNLQERCQINFGSGYTSDDRTIAFLKDWLKAHKEFPEFVRLSWITAKNLLDEVKQTKLDSF
ncbi:MAG: ribonuclease HII [Candidatus Helarchaeota archaeon]|nr:ribonuclease HII [Candidatus Helarchaeota archaeon]